MLCLNKKRLYYNNFQKCADEEDCYKGKDDDVNSCDSDGDDWDGQEWNGCRIPCPERGKPLHSPVFTSYKHFTKRWEWNEWIKLPVKYSDLPRTARLAVTVFDCCGNVAQGRRQVAVGSTTVKLFTRDGTLRQGPTDLRIWTHPLKANSSGNQVPLLMYPGRHFQV